MLIVGDRRVRLGLCLVCLSSLLVACGSSSKNPPASSSLSSSSQLSASVSSVVEQSSSSSLSDSVSSSSAQSHSSSSSSATSISSSSMSSPVLSSSSSSSTDQVRISGQITYDFVPFASNFIGLDYNATEVRPARGVIVELLDDQHTKLLETTSDAYGYYSFSLIPNTLVRVRVKARLQRTEIPTWTISVTDNTQGNALYVLDGSLVSSGASDSQRNLHAASGWLGSQYVAQRTAAPFAILDTVYGGLQRLLVAGNTQNLPALEFRWSDSNVTAAHPNDDFTTGEIGTSFYTGSAIYLLGEADVDSDEYDAHVILHEWTHYLEDVLARSDTPGGPHGYGDHLDFRVALSEGLGNSLAAMLLDDRYYRDSSGVEQAGGFAYSVSDKQHANRGWYSEASVESILYNYYLSANQKTARDFSYILAAMRANTFRQADSLTSIHLFVHQLQTLYPTHQSILDDLLNEQHIYGRGIYAENETNDAAYASVLPVYKSLDIGNPPINICSTPDFGKYNKLGVTQFLRLTPPLAGNYVLSVVKSGGAAVVTDPDFVVYRRGAEVARKESSIVDSESGTLALQLDTYIVEVYDWNNRDSSNTSNDTTCFDVQISP